VTVRELALALLAAAPLLPQSAELSGLITDPASLAVPGARLVVQSADTGATRSVSANQQGEYSVPALLPGPYNITVDANGFKTVHQNGVVVEVDQRARMDFALTVGNNTETVTVQGNAPPLNTSDASVSTLIGNRFVENLPLNGRSFSSPHRSDAGSSPDAGQSVRTGQFSVNGQRPDANYFLVDGVSANLGNAGNGALVSSNIPAPASGIWKAIFGNWSLDSIVYARTAPSVNVVTGLNPFGGYLSGAASVQRPDLVSGVPLWIADPNVAAERINPAAFSVPTAPRQGTLGRNALRGFGATQVDLTLRRQFKLRERLSLQARADFFNIFNHPNFGSPINYLSSPLFGQSTQILGTSLGSGGQSGGLNPLYQIGGPSLGATGSEAAILSILNFGPSS
jgi:hypothetical protein